MILYIVFILSVIFVIGFVGFSSKPSPIYGGLGLIVSGGVGCGIVLNFGGSFLGLMVFLIYLGGMMVVFGGVGGDVCGFFCDFFAVYFHGAFFHGAVGV